MYKNVVSILNNQSSNFWVLTVPMVQECTDTVHLACEDELGAEAIKGKSIQN